jgi:hypothetical protein
MAEDGGLNRAIETMLRNRKWGPPLQALLSWLHQTAKGEDDTETVVDEITKALPDASAYLRQKSTNWLTLLRRLEDAHCGDVVIGRRKFKTRFRWRVSPSQLARDALAFAGDNVVLPPLAANEEPASQGVERVHPFPLRHNMTVYVRVPADITREELNRLADFTRLLPDN